MGKGSVNLFFCSVVLLLNVLLYRAVLVVDGMVSSREDTADIT
jgi:hypothetical protein